MLASKKQTLSQFKKVKYPTNKNHKGIFGGVPITPSVIHVGWLVGLLVCPEKGWQLNFHAPIVALVFLLDKTFGS